MLARLSPIHIAYNDPHHITILVILSYITHDNKKYSIAPNKRQLGYQFTSLKTIRITELSSSVRTLHIANNDPHLYCRYRLKQPAQLAWKGAVVITGFQSKSDPKPAWGQWTDEVGQKLDINCTSRLIKKSATTVALESAIRLTSAHFGSAERRARRLRCSSDSTNDVRRDTQSERCVNSLRRFYFNYKLRLRLHLPTS